MRCTSERGKGKRNEEGKKRRSPDVHLMSGSHRTRLPVMRRTAHQSAGKDSRRKKERKNVAMMSISCLGLTAGTTVILEHTKSVILEHRVKSVILEHKRVILEHRTNEIGHFRTQKRSFWNTEPSPLYTFQTTSWTDIQNLARSKATRHPSLSLNIITHLFSLPG